MLRNFVKYFECYGAEILEDIARNDSVYMPYYYDKKIQSKFNADDDLSVPSLDFSIHSTNDMQQEKSIITSREKECLELIAKGYTKKKCG